MFWKVYFLKAVQNILKHRLLIYSISARFYDILSPSEFYCQRDFCLNTSHMAFPALVWASLSSSSSLTTPRLSSNIPNGYCDNTFSHLCVSSHTSTICPDRTTPSALPMMHTNIPPFWVTHTHPSSLSSYVSGSLSSCLSPWLGPSFCSYSSATATFLSIVFPVQHYICALLPHGWYLLPEKYHLFMVLFIKASRGLWVTCRCITKYHTFNSLKKTHIYCLTVSVGQEYEYQLGGFP